MSTLWLRAANLKTTFHASYRLLAFVYTWRAIARLHAWVCNLSVYNICVALGNVRDWFDPASSLRIAAQLPAHHLYISIRGVSSTGLSIWSPISDVYPVQHLQSSVALSAINKSDY